jgi:hypothetical protein
MKDDKKNAAAVALGALGGAKRRKMPKEQRVEIARRGGKALAAKRRKEKRAKRKSK